MNHSLDAALSLHNQPISTVDMNHMNKGHECRPNLLASHSKRGGVDLRNKNPCLLHRLQRTSCFLNHKIFSDYCHFFPFSFLNSPHQNKALSSPVVVSQGLILSLQIYILMQYYCFKGNLIYF